MKVKREAYKLDDVEIETIRKELDQYLGWYVKWAREMGIGENIVKEMVEKGILDDPLAYE